MLGLTVTRTSNLKSIGDKFVIMEWPGNDMYKLEQHLYYKHKKQSIIINYCEPMKQI